MIIVTVVSVVRSNQVHETAFGESLSGRHQSTLPAYNPFGIHTSQTVGCFLIDITPWSVQSSNSAYIKHTWS